ncbi:dTDP-4-dehydrorhamnose reductase [Rhizobium sp. XQZ8]|uniref:dTDP-4-dehydrorhamnose reductase n=1 Tax=Rhizobium populisoli TaxID=2859785 RepID=UPI001CA522DE|nr:dTDP-4-dehydrorhamnose reductase [Rhizobium populisoli]MBW6423192.1 dTDP-4-dehydrorhamnose reductase [Rhizobium populisoli]
MTKRYVVTGREGQVVRSLIERASTNSDIEVIPLGRPELDLASPLTVAAALEAARPDVVISAAAYTAVDQAESEEALASVINAEAPGVIAATAKRLGVPLVHISTDYVFDGEKSTPYHETDAVAPLGAYGRTKWAGELAVASATENYAILRTAWVYSPYGKNFLRTMLRLAETRDNVSVVADQVGNPTSALDIADGILQVAGNLCASDAPHLRGVFHMTAAGEASWADFASEIFRHSGHHNGPSAGVNRITTKDYPTPAKRPKNSRLNCTKLSSAHEVILPCWRASTEAIVASLVTQ